MLVSVALSLLGMGLVTSDFFGGHAVASGSIGGMAGGAKAQASSLNLLSYYAGSSLLGTAGGWFWTAGRWPAVAGFATLVLLGALGLAFRLSRTARPASS